MLELNRLYNMNCMDGMKEFPDKYFDLAIVDPPYGIFTKAKISAEQMGGAFAKYKKGVPVNSIIKHWDIAPPPEYFTELQRVSKNQVIWGGNYFDLPPTRCFLIWRKLTISESFSMAMAEYAWTSFNDNAKYYECTPQGTAKEPRFHPTQKPVSLYKWILSLYAEKGYKIIDTHAGSASSLIACYDMGFDYVGFEINKHYYDLAIERIEQNKLQIRMEI